MAARTRAIAATAVVALLSACGGSKAAETVATSAPPATQATDASTSQASTAAATAAATTTGALRPANEVRAEEQTAKARRATIGEPTQMGKLTVNVKSMTADRSGSDIWLRVALRFENATSGPLDAPSLAIYCAGNPEGGSWVVNSTVSMNATIPAGSFDEGDLNLLVPGNNLVSTETTPSCQGPAVVRAGSGSNAVDWVIPDDALVALGGTPAAPGATTIPPATTAATTPDDTKLAGYLLTADDLPGYTEATNEDDGETSPTDPAVCAEALDLGEAKPSSARVNFQQSDFGPFLFQVVARHGSVGDAKTAMKAFDALLENCSTFTETKSDGSKTTTNMTALDVRKVGDDRWGVTMTVTGGFLPGGATMIAVRKGAYTTVLLAFAIGGPAPLSDDLIAKAVDRLP